jgi:predicted phage gp36 major capsid-like protein
MAQKIERTRPEEPFVEIPNVTAEIDATTDKFRRLIDKFKADTQGVLDEFNRKIRGYKSQPVATHTEDRDTNEYMKQVEALRRNPDFKDRTSESIARLARSRSASPDARTIGTGTPSVASLPVSLGKTLHEGNVEENEISDDEGSEDDADAETRFQNLLADDSGRGGNGSKRKTKKRKHNLKKPWPTRSSRKRNGKGRKTRSHPRN